MLLVFISQRKKKTEKKKRISQLQQTLLYLCILSPIKKATPHCQQKLNYIEASKPNFARWTFTAGLH